MVHISVRSGADPRQLPEFELLREEIKKLSHPAQPEIDWALIESNALNIFKYNGMDLQTATYYALARSRKEGLRGVTEGCELLAEIITREWDDVWPENKTARVEILEWFNVKTAWVLRPLSFDEKQLPLLRRTERALQIIDDKLGQISRHNNVSEAASLLGFIQRAGSLAGEVKRQIKPASQRVRVEEKREDAVLPSAEAFTSEPQPKEGSSQSIVAACEPPAAPLWIHSPQEKKQAWRWREFIAGVFCALVVAGAVLSFYVIPMKQQLAEIARQPLGAALLWLSQPDIENYDRQLSRLADIQPWTVPALQNRSMELAQQHWPGDERQISQTRRWQVSTAATDGDASYFTLRQQLDALSNELLDKERSHSGMTLSYLKTAVYHMQNTLAAEVPLEELLRRLALDIRDNETASAALMMQINTRWAQLAERYYQLRQTADNAASEDKNANAVR